MSTLTKALQKTPQFINTLVKPILVLPSRDLAGTHADTMHTKYGGRHRVTLIHGDGIGPEMMFHIKEACRHVRAPVEFEELQLNSKNVSESMIEQAILAVKRNGAAIKGNVETNHNSLVDRSVNVELRKRLNLFANVVRCKAIPNVKTRHSDVDIMIIRENTEGEYANLEHENVSGVVESLKIVTRAKSIQIAEFAFERAVQTGRKKVTAVHKANIMKLGDGLFLECAREVAERYPQIEFESMIVDNTCMQLVSNPSQFDVMLMPNLYGNIIANLCTGLVGGAGLVAGSNYGPGCAVFEKGTRNSGKGKMGLNTANPSGMLFACANMLHYIGLPQHASVVKQSVLHTIIDHNMRTADIGGDATTTDFMKTVIEEIQQMTPEIGLDKGFGDSKTNSVMME